MRWTKARALLLLTVFLAVGAAANRTAASEQIPLCRLDNTLATAVSATLGRAIAAFVEMGKHLPVETVDVNSTVPAIRPKVLRIYIVTDAAVGKTDSHGCATATPKDSDKLDQLSVRGGCIVVALELAEIRCSAGAVKLFATTGRNNAGESAALLYLLSHELAHIQQNRIGEYVGRTEQITLANPVAIKLQKLRDACDPVFLTTEENADTLAFEILAKLLIAPPFREATLTERGSVYFNIDQLALVSNEWQNSKAIQELASRPSLHPVFEPQLLPTPAKTIHRNANIFVCAVLKKQTGSIAYPGKSISHPPIEQRLRRIAEKLKPLAVSLPASGGNTDYAPIVSLQQDLGAIFTYMYRETGVYLEALQSDVCSIANSANPISGCP